MPSFVGRVSDRQIFFSTTVSVWEDNSESPKIPNRTYITLLDTGAQATMISPKVVAEANLTPIGDMNIAGINGAISTVDSFLITLGIPIGMRIPKEYGKTETEILWRGMAVEVGTLPYQPVDYDVLLGMDILMTCHLTLHDNLFVLST